MFAIGRVLQKTVFRMQPQTFTSLSVYDIQELSMQEPSNIKEIKTNVFSILSVDNKKEDELINRKTLDEIKQEECMYHLAKP